MGLCAALAGCPVARPRDAITEPGELLRLYAGLRARAKSLRAIARVDHFGEGGRVRGKVYVFVERPAKLRFETVTPFDNALSTLVSDGANFALLDARANRFYRGPADACNVSRLLRIPLPPEDVANALLGGTPLIAHRSSRLAWDDDGFYALSLEGIEDGVRQSIHFAPSPSRLDVIESVVRDRRGVVFRLAFDDPRTVEGVPLPMKIRFEMPRADADVLVRYDDVDVNPNLPADAWTLAPPPGAPVEEVRCP